VPRALIGRDLLAVATDLPNAPNSHADFFLAGDVRTNEHVGLTALPHLRAGAQSLGSVVSARSNAQ
jgi:hypothetical protein